MHSAEKRGLRLHMPLVDRAAATPAPYLVCIAGPPKCGKSTVIRSLVKHYTGQKVTDIRGPITMVTAKNRRLTLFECPNELGAMCDLAKTADLILLMVDASFGFEMEVFEFLNILKVHGMPKVMGVLTHLDKFKDNKKLNLTKRKLKHRFWTEICDGINARSLHICSFLLIMVMMYVS